MFFFSKFVKTRTAKEVDQGNIEKISQNLLSTFKSRS